MYSARGLNNNINSNVFGSWYSDYTYYSKNTVT